MFVVPIPRSQLPADIRDHFVVSSVNHEIFWSIVEDYDDYQEDYVLEKQIIGKKERKQLQTELSNKFDNWFANLADGKFDEWFARYSRMPRTKWAQKVRLRVKYAKPALHEQITLGMFRDEIVRQAPWLDLSGMDAVLLRSPSVTNEFTVYDEQNLAVLGEFLKISHPTLPGQVLQAVVEEKFDFLRPKGAKNRIFRVNCEMREKI